MGKTFILFLFIVLFFAGPVFAGDRSSNGPSVMDRVGVDAASEFLIKAPTSFHFERPPGEM
jgi:hypothetical protein